MTKIERAWGAGALVVALWGCTQADSDSEASHTDAGTKIESARTDADGGSEVRRYVGALAGTDIRLAVLTDASRARLFFCGGETGVASDTHWFNLTREGEALQNEDGEYGLNARFAPAAVSGEYRVRDQRHRFEAEPVVPGTLSGLFEGTGDCGRLGLIVSQDTPGGEIRAQGACVGPEHAPEQVNPILPIASEDGSIRVRAPRQQDDTLLLEAAELTPR